MISALPTARSNESIATDSRSLADTEGSVDAAFNPEGRVVLEASIPWSQIKYSLADQNEGEWTVIQSKRTQQKLKAAATAAALRKPKKNRSQRSNTNTNSNNNTNSTPNYTTTSASTTSATNNISIRRSIQLKDNSSQQPSPKQTISQSFATNSSPSNSHHAEKNYQEHQDTQNSYQDSLDSASDHHSDIETRRHSMCDNMKIDISDDEIHHHLSTDMRRMVMVDPMLVESRKLRRAQTAATLLEDLDDSKLDLTMGTEDFLKDILIKSLEESYRIAICENDFDFCFTVMDYLTEYMEKFDELVRIMDEALTENPVKAPPKFIPSRQSSYTAINPMSRSSSSSWSDAVKSNLHRMPPRHPSKPPRNIKDIRIISLAVDEPIEECNESEIYNTKPDTPSSLSSSNMSRHRKLPEPSTSPQHPPAVRRTPDPMELDKKHAKAQALRMNILTNKAEKLRSKQDKIQEVRVRQQTQIEEQQKQLQQIIVVKHEKAQNNRVKYLKSIQIKAKEEKTKLDEIAFISALSIENKKMEVLERHEECSARLQEKEGERLRKQAEVARSQEAAFERRRIQEEERIAKLQREAERRKELETKKEMERQQQLASRQAALEEKARRIKEFKENKQAEEEDKRRVLHQRMAKAKERHEEKLVQVKERAAAANVQAKEIALRVNVSRKTPEGKRFCLVCNVAFHGDVSRHNNGKAHQQRLLAKTESNHDLAGGKEMWKKIASSPSLSTLNSIANAGANSTVGASTSSTNIVEDVNKSLYPVERDKAIKRRAKKIRMRLRALVEQFSGAAASNTAESATASSPTTASTTTSTGKTNLDYLLGQVTDICGNLHQKHYRRKVDGLDKIFEDVTAILTKENPHDLDKVRESGAFASIVKAICSVDGFARPNLPPKTINHGLQVLKRACLHDKNREYVLLSSDQISVELSELLCRLIPYCGPSADDVLLATSALCSLLTWVLVYDDKENNLVAQARDEFRSYMLCIEILDRLRDILLVVHGPINPQSPLVVFLHRAMALLETISGHAIPNLQSLPVYADKGPIAKSIASAFNSTELVGIVTMLDALVLYKGQTAKTASSEKLPLEIIEITYRALKTLNNIALLDVMSIQNCLNAEGLQSEFFHLIAFWLRHCSLWCQAPHRASSTSGNNSSLPTPGSSIMISNANATVSGATTTATTALSTPAAPPASTSTPSTPAPASSATTTTTTNTTSLPQHTHKDTHELSSKVLHELILLVGYFSLRNSKSQALLRWGPSPVILKLMVDLPFEYFSEPRLMNILFPTLIIACYKDDDNKQIVEEDLSLDMLCKFVEMRERCCLDRVHRLPKRTTDDGNETTENGDTEDFVLSSIANSFCKEDSDSRSVFEKRFPKELWNEAVGAF